jgi:hypothetical protein
MGAFKSLLAPSSLRILFPIGLALAAWCGWQWRSESALIARAVEVEAVVLAASVEPYSTGSGTSRENQWRPLVRYRYAVDGSSYESDRVTPLGKGGSRGWANELVARFAVGEPATAYVDPGDPERAFLVPVRSWKDRAGVAVGVTIALVAGALLVLRRP